MFNQPLETRARNVWLTVAKKHVETLWRFPRCDKKLGNHPFE
jgi:hypothetical protein